jgi:hypothetical protein
MESESGMNIPDHSSGSLETFFWIKKYLKLGADPGSFGPWVWDGKIRIRDEKSRLRNTA